MKKNKIIIGTMVLVMGAILTTGCKAKLKNGEEVAIQVNGKNITADTLYKELKNKYAKQIIIDDIDKKIFSVMFKNDEEIEKQVNNQLEYIKNQYSSNFEETLKSAGYNNENELKDEIRLSYQRTKAVDTYLKDSIKEDEIKKYYNDEYSGEISAKHILIKVKSSDSEDGLSDEEALKKAKDLIKELNNGADFSTLAKENSDDTGSKENGGDLGYFKKGQMVSEFETAAFDLKVNEYTKEPVKTTYGYHIILKTGEKEKQALKDVKEEIINTLVTKKKEDKTINVTALDAIRKNYKLKFKDSKLKKIYNEYIDEQLKSASSTSN
ncbi:MAG: peptidylprolyl isomerase [Bacilli bacterium]|nr:peptidylprolyl isomerase [Bacilli bacterium]